MFDESPSMFYWELHFCKQISKNKDDIKPMSPQFFS